MFGLAHMAFMAIGSYTSALLATRLGLSFWLCLIAAGASALFWGVAFGYLVLRLRRMYFFLCSFMVAGIIETIFANFWEDLFGGHAGITRIPPPDSIVVGALKIDFSSYGHYYYLILVIMLLTVFILYRLNKSAYGMVFHAIRMAPDLVPHLGVNVVRYKVLAFSIGCFFAGIAGAFFAHFHHTIAPVDFGVWPCVGIQIFVILGGQHYFWGPVLGAIIMTFLFGYLARFGFYQQIAYGSILLFMMIFVPEGLMSLVPRISPFFQKLSIIRWRQ
jgi:branched-chain amino acid transport system permease protein